MTINIPWSKSVSGASKKRIKELGNELEEALYKAGVRTVDDLKKNRTKVARIIAKTFAGEVTNLIQFGQNYINEEIPDMAAVLPPDTTMEE